MKQNTNKAGPIPCGLGVCEQSGSSVWEMSHLDCDLNTITPAGLPEIIRCQVHADAAARNGNKTHRLGRTLNLMKDRGLTNALDELRHEIGRRLEAESKEEKNRREAECNRIRAKREFSDKLKVKRQQEQQERRAALDEARRQIKAKKDARDAAAHAAEEQRRLEEEQRRLEAARSAQETERQQRLENTWRQTVEYVQGYAQDTYNTASKVPRPSQWRRRETSGSRCGLPADVGCCSHRQPTEHFIAVYGDVVDICPRAAKAFALVAKEIDDPDQNSLKLRVTRNRSKAERWADEWLRDGQRAEAENGRRKAKFIDPRHP